MRKEQFIQEVRQNIANMTSPRWAFILCEGILQNPLHIESLIEWGIDLSAWVEELFDTQMIDANQKNNLGLVVFTLHQFQQEKMESHQEKIIAEMSLLKQKKFPRKKPGPKPKLIRSK